MMSLMVATLAVAHCTTDPEKAAWGPARLVRAKDANCTCEFWATSYACAADKHGRHYAYPPTLLWALSYPGGCGKRCNELPGYESVMVELETHEHAGYDQYECDDEFVDLDEDGIAACLDANDEDSRVGVATSTVPPETRYYDDNFNSGFGPWSCGDFTTGKFFIDCDMAWAYMQRVFCTAPCGCQKEYEDAFKSQCPVGYPDRGTQCGTTCACVNGDNKNPFSDNCDCSSQPRGQCQGVDMQGPTGTDGDGMSGQGGCSFVVDLGVSPGPNTYPPADCSANPGPWLVGGTAGNDAHLVWPPTRAVGTTANGQSPAPAPNTGSSGPSYGPNDPDPSRPAPWAPRKHLPRVNIGGRQ